MVGAFYKCRFQFFLLDFNSRAAITHMCGSFFLPTKKVYARVTALGFIWFICGYTIFIKIIKNIQLNG
jgi:hypothetical protein